MNSSQVQLPHHLLLYLVALRLGHFGNVADLLQLPAQAKLVHVLEFLKIQPHYVESAVAL